MKLRKVLLRWYKSFHLNYRGVSTKGEIDGYRPWNRLSPKHANLEEFPFIEVPIDSDITTIVGANESGKSHLLNAISKIVKGVGLDGTEEFSQTDLCHYAGIRTRNVEAWPNIGVQFTLGQGDFEALNEAVGEEVSDAKSPTFAVVLAPDQEPTRTALLFVEPSTEAVALTDGQLVKIRELMPSVEFIDSKARLAGEIPLARLLAVYDPEHVDAVPLPNRNSLEKAVAFILSIEPKIGDQVNAAAFGTKVDDFQKRLRSLGGEQSADGLELHLFRDILRISQETLQKIYDLTSDKRGFAEGLVAKWNEEIKDKLNLSHFWSQDEQFELTVDYKDGIIYFEIGDKTGSVYTFNERSSGLKSFLSYYIQAKAMEMTNRNRNAIILMDEPDSALSILGQRNLLRVFESLVRPESSDGTCQLIYTTHSPYLINRNFPRRIRVVKKEEAEQGSQFIERARSRRYEPVRTALGIDAAPSLFLGSDNLLLEGATDQYFIAEMIRVFATPQNVGQFLDLNGVEIVSADGVGNVLSVLKQSYWADEPIPATVVLVDGDKSGRDVARQLIEKKVLDPALVMVLSDIVKPFGENTAILTIEDLVPKALYFRAVRQYLERWWPSLAEEKAESIDVFGRQSDLGQDGLVASVKDLFVQIQPEYNGDYDKMSVLQEVITIAEIELRKVDVDIDEKADAPDGSQEAGGELRANLELVCDAIRNGLTRARAATAKHSTTQAIKRIVNDFSRLNKANVPVTTLQQLFIRLEREVTPIGDDAKNILNRLNEYSAELGRLRAAGQQRVAGDEWNGWQSRIESLKNNALGA